MIHNKFVHAVLFVSLSLLVTVIADAQATRTWVSGVGDDVNPCSRTAPCKTFAGAISKTAGGGEINCLDPGGFGAVTITKSITIDCEDTQGSILASGTNGVVINITADTDAKKAVRIRGISINGAGGSNSGGTGVNGIRILAANSLSVEDVVIDSFGQNGISVECAAQVAVRNSSIRATQTGVNALAAGSDVIVTGSSITFSTTGISSATSGMIRIGESTIAYNKTGLSGPGKIFSFGDNVIDGNGSNGAATSTPLK
jgi:hypothetical protein